MLCCMQADVANAKVGEAEEVRCGFHACTVLFGN